MSQDHQLKSVQGGTRGDGTVDRRQQGSRDRPVLGAPSRVGWVSGARGPGPRGYSRP